MLIAALILVLSVGATVQFAVLSWHAGVLRTAAQLNALAASTDPGLRAIAAEVKDFDSAIAYRQLCPDLGSNSNARFGSVQLYHRLLQSFNSLRRKFSPADANAAGGWASREMALCTSYAQVVLAQRVQHNRAVLSDLGSF